MQLGQLWEPFFGLSILQPFPYCLAGWTFIWSETLIFLKMFNCFATSYQIWLIVQNKLLNQLTFLINILPILLEVEDNPFPHHQQGRIDFNTVTFFNTVRREEFADALPVESLMMRECPYSTKTREVLGNPSPLGRRGWISQYLPRLGGARIQSHYLAPIKSWIVAATSHHLLRETKNIVLGDSLKGG